MPKSRLKRNGWNNKRLMLCLLFGLFAVIWTWPTWALLFNRLIDADPFDQYLVLVPVVVVWVVWVRRCRLQYAFPQFSILSSLLLVGGLVGWTLLNHQVQANPGPCPDAWLQHLFGWVAVLGGGTLFIGWRVLVHFLPAVFGSVLLVPMPSWVWPSLSEAMDGLAARLLVQVINALGGNARVEGMQFILDEQSLPYYEVCPCAATAGVLTVACFGLVFGQPMKASSRALVLLLCPIIALLASVATVLVSFWMVGTQSLNQPVILHTGHWLVICLGVLLVLAMTRALDNYSPHARPYASAYQG